MSRLTPLLTLIALSALACGPSYRDVYPRTPPAASYSAYLHYQLALQNDQHEDALEHIVRALQHDPESPVLHHAHADLLARVGHPELALRKLDDLIDDHPDWPPPRYTRARILHDNLARHQDAARILDPLLTQHPEHTDAAWLRARVALALDQPDDARSALTLLTEHHPYHRLAWRELATLAQNADDPATAANHLQRLLDLTELPSEDLFLELADALFQSQQEPRALDVLQQCADLSSAYLLCQERLAHAILTTSPDDPEQLQRLVTTIASNTTLLISLTRSLRTENPTLAAPFITLILELRPELSDLALDLGEVHLALNQPREAALAFQRVDPRSPFKAHAEQRLGHALILTGQRDDAIDALERSRSLEPHNPNTLLLLGDAYRAAGLTQDANGLYQLALEHTRDAHLLETLQQRLDTPAPNTP